VLPLTISFSLSSFPGVLSSVFFIFYDSLLDIQYWLFKSLRRVGGHRHVTLFPAGSSGETCANSNFRLCNKLKHRLPPEMNLTHANYGTGGYINSRQHARLKRFSQRRSQSQSCGILSLTQSFGDASCLHLRDSTSSLGLTWRWMRLVLRIIGTYTQVDMVSYPGRLACTEITTQWA
jgi:hypothetical protein